MTISQVWYFASVHVIILLSIGVSLWLVVKKSMTDAAFTLGAHGSTFLAFGICLLIYLVLRVFEADPSINREIRKFVGHVGHLAGALAALFLVFLLSPITAACLVPFWFVWFLAAVSITLVNLMFPHNRSSGANLPV